MWQQIIFWAAAALLVYTYAGYPLLMRGWAAARAAPRRQADIEPSVSIVVAAYNEEGRIGRKIENLLALDYPRERLEIVIASDASTDATVARAMEYGDRGVRVVAFDQRRGKPAILNEVVPTLRGEVVVLMDVRQRVEPHCLRALVADFADPGTGAVGGELMLEQDGSEVGEGVGFYWRYEKFIRQQEARVDSTVGTSGALYAIRRELFRPIPEDTLLDDVLIPMQVVRQGHRVVLEPSARAYDRVAETAEAEFTRKVRTIAGNFQLFLRHGWLLNPFANRLWFQTVSHKFCRLLGPLCLALAFGTNLLLLEHGFYQLLMSAQILFYTAALAAHWIPQRRRKPALLNVAHAFCLLNWATVMGLVRLMLGRQRVTWQKAEGGSTTG